MVRNHCKTCSKLSRIVLENKVIIRFIHFKINRFIQDSKAASINYFLRLCNWEEEVILRLENWLVSLQQNELYYKDLRIGDGLRFPSIKENHFCGLFIKIIKCTVINEIRNDETHICSQYVPAYSKTNIISDVSTR